MNKGGYNPYLLWHSKKNNLIYKTIEIGGYQLGTKDTTILLLWSLICFTISSCLFYKNVNAIHLNQFALESV